MNIVVLGFDIPKSDTLFLIVLGIHILAGIICVGSAIIACLAVKGSPLHIKYGKIYYKGLIVVVITMSYLTIVRFSEDIHLFILGIFSFGFAVPGVLAMRKKWKDMTKWHIICMGMSFILLLTAFYVDNGKFLPVWNRLPVLSYWLLPGGIGIPLIIKAFKKYTKKDN